MSRSKAFDNIYDFMIGYTAAMLGENRGEWVVFLKNKATSLVEALRMPMFVEGGLLSTEEQRLISWEEIASNYTFVDGTPCRSR